MHFHSESQSIRYELCNLDPDEPIPYIEHYASGVFSHLLAMQARGEGVTVYYQLVTGDDDEYGVYTINPHIPGCNFQMPMSGKYIKLFYDRVERAKKNA